MNWGSLLQPTDEAIMRGILKPTDKGIFLGESESGALSVIKYPNRTPSLWGKSYWKLINNLEI